MTPERWHQLKQIFNSAIGFPREKREAYLSEACSDDALLRREVESLITAHEKSGEFIDDPAYAGAAPWLGSDDADFKPGQAVGSFEILSFISRGGMGEVYLGQDKRLNRKVALKVLPIAYTRESDRLRRFEQEARAASALNHPNILTIYEIDQAGSTHVIATEFVDGETVRQRLSRAPLSQSETLNIAIQVADALSAAHKVGIIHRDIKPENVMVRPDGYVKVLDFGLAKLTEQATPAVAAEAPTIQVRTGSGIVIGTAGYMSPEQARGQAVDGRSDIFSLGAVIYEMIARRKPFEGETPSDTLASILKTEPPPLSHVAPAAPAELVRIVNKCLRKDREERYQVVKDLWLDLKALKQELEFQEKLERSVVPDAAQPTAVVAREQSTDAISQVTQTGNAISAITQSLSFEIRKHKLGTALSLLALLFIVAGGAFGIYKYVNRPRAISHFWDIRLSRLTNSGNVIDATLSPDGKYVAYVLSDRSSQSLWIRQVTAANDKEILSRAPIGFFGITFSPDGTELYYAVKANLDSGTLYRVPMLGGTPVKVLDRIDAPVSFSPDGKQFVLLRGNYPNRGESALVVANADGSGQYDLVVKKLPERLSPIFFTGPSWSPDGKSIAAVVASIGGGSKLVSFSLAGHKETALSQTTWPFAARVQWLPDMTGLLLVAGETVREAQLWVIDSSSGEARRVTNDLSTYRAIGLTADGKKFSAIQADGLINLWVAPNGDATKAIRLPTGNIGFYTSNQKDLCWTVDGRIAYVSNEGGTPEIWLANPDGTNRKQLTSTGTYGLAPFASPDGRYFVFVSKGGGGQNVWRINVDGSNPVRLTEGLADTYPSITSDGRWVIFTRFSEYKPTLWKVSIEGGKAVQLTDHNAVAGIVSPDMKWLAFFYPESSDPSAPPNRIGVIPFEGTGELKTFSMSPGGTVSPTSQWSNDSKSVYYSTTANNTTNIWSQPISGGPAKQVTDFKDSLMTGFAWSPDGKQLAATRGVLLRDAVLITEVK